MPSSAPFPPSPPSPTAEACAELAALTVRLFPPSVVASVRDVFARNPRLDLSEHLPLLGTLVVRHVALSLAEDDLDVDVDEQTPQSPVLEKHEKTTMNDRRIEVDILANTPPLNRRLPRDARRRSSYRDVAYYAVRQKRIVPESLPVDKEEDESTTTTTRPVRRLSIRSMRLPRDAAMRKSRSDANVEVWRAQREDATQGDTKGEEKVIRRRHSPQFWNEQSEAATFPRADVSTSIQSSSMRALKSENKPHAVQRRENKGRGSPWSVQNKGVQGRAAPVSKLMQLRKQRLEKRGKPIR